MSDGTEHDAAPGRGVTGCCPSAEQVFQAYMARMRDLPLALRQRVDNGELELWQAARLLIGQPQVTRAWHHRPGRRGLALVRALRSTAALLAAIVVPPTERLR